MHSDCRRNHNRYVLGNVSQFFASLYISKFFSQMIPNKMNKGDSIFIPIHLPKNSHLNQKSQIEPLEVHTAHGQLANTNHEHVGLVATPASSFS